MTTHEDNSCSTAAVEAAQPSMAPPPVKARGSRLGLLDLPVELILGIAEVLTPCEQLLFAQSCRGICNTVTQFRVGVFKKPESLPDSLSHIERLKYLHLITRLRADVFVCVECDTLHSVQPKNLSFRDPRNGCRPRFQDTVGLDYMGFEVLLRQKQLALKYARLLADGEGDPDVQAGLNKLTSPFHVEQEHSYPHMTLFSSFSALSRVVNGRFMLHNVLRVHDPRRTSALETGNGWDVSHNAMTRISVCMHQHSSCWERYYRDRVARTASFPRPKPAVRRPVLMPPFEQALRVTDAMWDHLNCVLFEAVDTAQFPRFPAAPINPSVGYPAGQEVFGSCRYCATDFSVVIENNAIKVSTWIDLGGEALDDPNWLPWIHDTREMQRKPRSVMKAWIREESRKLSASQSIDGLPRAAAPQTTETGSEDQAQPKNGDTGG